MTEAAPPAPPPAAPPASASAAPPTAPKKGVIHDLGYARYAGERRATSTLWRVIMRHQIKYVWKTWWRWKPALLGALLTVVSVGVVMYLSRDKVFDALRTNGVAVRFLDGMVPMSFKFFRICAFIITMTVAATGIARDRETGAFAFYFSRPVRPRDYVLGKLAGMIVVMASIFLAGPLLLAAFRIGLSRDTDELLRLLPWLARVLLVGTLASVVYAAAPMAMSALIGKRWIALGAWAGYWIIGISMVAGIGFITYQPLIAIDPGIAIDTLALRLWGLEAQDEAAGASMTACLISLGVHIVAMVSLLYWRVSRQVESSVGASS